MYRGVSKNGPNYQVLFMAHKKREYVGGIKTELEAAMIYDEIAIKAHGYKVFPFHHLNSCCVGQNQF